MGQESPLLKAPEQMFLVLKEKKSRQISSAERGSLMTVVTYMSAGGVSVPPLFPRDRLKAELLNVTPPGTVAACRPSGWTQTYIHSVVRTLY
jgi:hypothetical protein